MISSTSQPRHVILVAMAGYGHIIPMVAFAKRLSSNHRISLVVFECFVEQLAKRGMLPPPETAGKQEASPIAFGGNFSNIRVVSISSPLTEDLDASGAGNLIEGVCSMPPTLQSSLSKAADQYGWNDTSKTSWGTHAENQASAENYNNWWPQLPSCVSSDYFLLDGVATAKGNLSWADDIPLIAFIPTSVNAYINIYESALEAKDTMDVNQAYSAKKLDPTEAFVEMKLKEGEKGIDFKSLPHDMQLLFFKSSIAAQKCSALLLDTFDDWEAADIPHIRKNHPELPPLVCIGPLCGWEIFADNNSIQLSKDHALILGWLDQQPANSTIYVSFGSLAHLDDKQVRELEKALRECGHPFIWSLRAGSQQAALSKDTHDERASPDDKHICLKKTAFPGLISTWCPQSSILSHRSVGGFITHCGWNSSQESIVAGIPVITWPMFAEQHMNADFLKSLGVAVNLEKTKQYGRIVEAAEIKAAINSLFKNNGGELSHFEKAAALRDKARASISEGGLPRRNWESFPNIPQLVTF